MTPKLSDEALAEIEARSKKYKDFADRAATPGDEKVVRWFAKQVAALCATVRALREENEQLKNVTIPDSISDLVRRIDASIRFAVPIQQQTKLRSFINELIFLNAALRDQLAQLTRERDDYRDQLVEAKAETVERLAQVEEERNTSQGNLK